MGENIKKGRCAVRVRGEEGSSRKVECVDGFRLKNKGKGGCLFLQILDGKKESSNSEIVVDGTEILPGCSDIKPCEEASDIIFRRNHGSGCETHSTN